MFIQVLVFDADGNQIDATVVTTSPDDVQPWIEENEEKWPDGYKTEVSDLTQRFADQADAAAGLKAMEVGRSCVALAYAINDKKQLSSAQLNAMFADPTLAMAERLLKNGALLTGKAALQAVDKKFFTAEEIKRVTDFIDRELAK